MCFEWSKNWSTYNLDTKTLPVILGFALHDLEAETQRPHISATRGWRTLNFGRVNPL